MHRSIVDIGYSQCAPFWDGLFGDRTDEVRFWAETARPYGNRVLAPLAATGEIAANLACQGFEVTALDCCSEMLTIAREKAKDIPTLHCRQGTVEDMSGVDSRFDFVFFAGGDYHHYYDEAGQLTVLENVHRLLRPGGGFGLEMLPFRSDRPEKDVSLTRTPGLRVSAEESWEPEGRMLCVDQTVCFEDDDREDEHFHIPLRMFTRVELVSSLAQVGFRRVAEFGSPAREPHTPASSRWFVLAERRSGC